MGKIESFILGISSEAAQTLIMAGGYKSVYKGESKAPVVWRQARKQGYFHKSMFPILSFSLPSPSTILKSMKRVI